MYAQLEKPKENKSRSVENSVAQKKSNVKQGFGFVDNRSDFMVQKRLNNKPNIFTDKRAVSPMLQNVSVGINDDSRVTLSQTLQKKNISNEVVQLALPHNGDPNTKKYYNAKDSAKTINYASGRPTKFSTAFKRKMIEHEWHGKKNPENGLWYVMTQGSSNHNLPEIALQIDHTTPWDSIEGKLKENPSTKLTPTNLVSAQASGLVNPAGDSYTLYAARMYYHDVDNLKPMSGSENASKGDNANADNSFDVDGDIQEKTNTTTGIFHNMIGEAVGALKDWGSDAAYGKNLYDKIDSVEKNLKEATDYFISF